MRRATLLNRKHRNPVRSGERRETDVQRTCSKYTHITSRFIRRGQPNLGYTEFCEFWNLRFEMFPPTHVGMGTIPRKELDLLLFRQESKPPNSGLTMSAFPEFLSGPKDIRVKAPPGVTVSVPVSVSPSRRSRLRSLENMSRDREPRLCRLACQVSAYVQSPPAITVSIT